MNTENTIHFDCPGCGARITVIAASDTATAWCRTCKHSLRILSEGPDMNFGWGGDIKRRRRRDSAPARNKWRKHNEDVRATRRATRKGKGAA